MNASSLSRVFAGSMRTFQLGMGEWELLQAELDVGPFMLEHMFHAKMVRPVHQKAVLKFGLIGGGMDETEAYNLVEATVIAGTLNRYITIAHLIIVKFIGTDDEEELDDAPKKPNPLEAGTKSDQTDS